ncbi:MAG: hypothetical protein BAA01_10685 [Bacillus thermozeamaize]|mgnify:CR=1 FL=1|uniref:Cupin type-2 domain-containing protein n=1 Tax=Bacillus thermozeamaize TaxID=230954 RepID=A0A1Y3PRY8_9BACI|nr:MAG: hypothetical protein BAA01_10685 [Bacillus thermozeamaize]
MGFWRHVNEVETYVPPGHAGTFNRRLVGLADGMKNVEVIIGEMEEGGSALPHFHDDVEQVMYILEGKMYVEIDGEQAELTAGHAVWIPKGAMHEVKNAGPGKLRFVLMYAPPKSS